ncbi:SURF1 family protein [bacterium]|nr:SURF1 family protein [bacterium]
MARTVLGWVAVVGALTLFSSLGMWQWERHQEQQELLAIAHKELALLPLENEEVLAGGGPMEGGRRLVVLEGEFVGKPQLVVGYFESSQPGFRVVMRFLVGGNPDYAILVDRGWLPQEGIETHLDALPTNDRIDGIAAFLPAWKGNPRLEGNHWRGFAPQEMAADLGLSLLGWSVIVGKEKDPAGHPPSPSLPVTGWTLPVRDTPHLPYAITWFSGVVLVLGYALWAGLSFQRKLRD